MATPFEFIQFEVRDQVATLTLNNPAARNAFGVAMRGEIAQAISTVRDDASIRALVLTGAGGHFCAGGDIRGMVEASQLDAAGWRQRMRSLHGWVTDLIELDRPVIAAVDGSAFGAGFSLALAADMVVATPRARFCMSFLRIGFVPDCGALFTLPRVVGVQRAREIMLSAREVGAEEALRLGIAMELVPPDDLQARARTLAASFVNASPMAVSLIKRALAVPGAGLPEMLDMEADAQALAAGTTEHKAAVQRFLAKEPTLFQWPVTPTAHAPSATTGGRQP